MPVVIRELVITATVDENAAARSAAAPPAEATRQLVEQVVAQVLAILKEQRER